ncbi:MAG TPA: hypothetical protein VFF28_05020 [Candidatus Nanoarchaeia archaeon]|nr:hypothetical protein [Candidatus Nanoarchaeia archaeon]
MGELKLSFFAVDVILLVVFLGLTRTVFRLSGIGFVLELLALIILLFAAFIALVPAYSGSRGGWGFLAIVFAVIFIDLLFIFLATGRAGTAFTGALLFSALGLLVSVLNVRKKEKPVMYEEKPAHEEVYTNFEPGKYVASKTGTTYHAPKCEWALKIKKKNQIWFDDEKEAKKRFSPHSCIK